MKKLLTIMIALALIAGAGVMKAEAATSDGITITVTIRVVSVLVSPANLDIGFFGLSETKASSTLPIDIENNGNATEDFSVVGTDASDGAASTWDISAAAGASAFDFGLKESGGSLVDITETSVSLKSGVTAGTNVDYDYSFTAPSSTSSYLQHSFSATVSASASP
jgi:hypothetical protein